MLAFISVLMVSVSCINTYMELNVPRCFVVSVGQPGQTLKVELIMPQIRGLYVDEGFEITWTSTQDGTTERVLTIQQIYYHELHLQPGVMYDFCYRIKSRVPNYKPVSVSFNSYVHVPHTNKKLIMDFDKIAKAAKVQNLTNLVLDLNNMQDEFRTFQDRRFEKQQQYFYQIHEFMKSIFFYGVLQAILLMALCCLQLCALRKIIPKHDYKPV